MTPEQRDDFKRQSMNASGLLIEITRRADFDVVIPLLAACLEVVGEKKEGGMLTVAGSPHAAMLVRVQSHEDFAVVRDHVNTLLNQMQAAFQKVSPRGPSPN
jgi:hypothetical protein